MCQLGRPMVSASLQDDRVPRYGELILRLLAQTLTENQLCPSA